MDVLPLSAPPPSCCLEVLGLNPPEGRVRCPGSDQTLRDLMSRRNGCGLNLVCTGDTCRHASARLRPSKLASSIQYLEQVYV